MHQRNALSFLSWPCRIVLAIAALLPGAVHAEDNDLSLNPAASLSSYASPASMDSTGNTLTTQELRGTINPISSIDLTATSDNIWDRIRNGFGMSNLNDDLVLYYQQWYMNRPDALRRMAERSRPYLHHIVQEIEARGMPTELALLPMVESSFNPMAYSRANASGLWQFIPATGKRFNLTQNWWRDDRRDIVASTNAALDYLQSIYDMHGDWHLALASYNWGEGAVKRAVDKNSERDMPTDYGSLSMPDETRHYVPKLQALKNIFGDPVLVAELRLPKITNSPYFSSVYTGEPIDIKTAARLANMPIEEFLALNPSHNRPVISANSSIILPTDRLNTFRNNLEQYKQPLTSWQAYTLKNGEKLSKVAPRFGLSLNDLLRINGLNSKVKLGGGTTLLVPAGRGGRDIDDQPNMTPPVQLAETSRKSGKQTKSAKDKKSAGKGKASSSKVAKGSKNGGKQASTKATKSTGKVAKGAAKPKKVAKSRNGRSG